MIRTKQTNIRFVVCTNSSRERKLPIMIILPIFIQKKDEQLSREEGI